MPLTRPIRPAGLAPMVLGKLNPARVALDPGLVLEAGPATEVLAEEVLVVVLGEGLTMPGMRMMLVATLAVLTRAAGHGEGLTIRGMLGAPEVTARRPAGALTK